jgi:hypothetical protein
MRRAAAIVALLTTGLAVATPSTMIAHPSASAAVVPGVAADAPVPGSSVWPTGVLAFVVVVAFVGVLIAVNQPRDGAKRAAPRR